MKLIEFDSSQLTILQIVPSFSCFRGCHYCYNEHLHQVDVDAQPERVLETMYGVLATSKRPSLEIELIGGEPLQPPALRVTTMILREARKIAGFARRSV